MVAIGDGPARASVLLFMPTSKESLRILCGKGAALVKRGREIVSVSRRCLLFRARRTFSERETASKGEELLRLNRSARRLPGVETAPQRVGLGETLIAKLLCHTGTRAFVRSGAVDER